jgi:microcystin-dependent protein
MLKSYNATRGYVESGTAAGINVNSPFVPFTPSTAINDTDSVQRALEKLQGSINITGIVKGNGTSLSAATSGTDYSAGTYALATGIVKSTTVTGELTIAVADDFPTLNQSTTGTAASVTGTNVVTNTNLSTMPTNTIKGNNTGSTATPIDLTSTQVTGMLNTMVGDSGSGGTKGLAPAPAAGDAAAGKFLKADGTYAVPAGATTGDTKTGLQSADHSNWLLWTNGRSLSRTTYATLWNFVNTNSLVATGLFGAGDGATTFTLGDINGRAIGIVGSGAGLTARNLGFSTGTETQTLTTDNLPPHNHGILGDSARGLSSEFDNDKVLYNEDGAVRNVLARNTEFTGSGTAHNNMQPTVFLNFFVFSG